MVDVKTIIEMAKAIGVDKIVGTVIKQLTREEKSKAPVTFSQRNISKGLPGNLEFEDHATEVATWASTMEYKYAGKPLRLDRGYLNLEIWLEPYSFGGRHVSTGKGTIWELINSAPHHIVLLGRPGTGKTTTLKAICRALLQGDSKVESFYPIPIVLRLRELTSHESLFGALLQYLGIDTGFQQGFLDRPDAASYLRNAQLRLLAQVLNKVRFLIVVDGFDELSLEAKKAFPNDFQALTREISLSLIILTSRSGDFIYSVTNTTTYELAVLSLEQIHRFIDNFFMDAPSLAGGAKLEIVERKLLGAEAIPLTLVYLCMIYQRYGRLFNSRRQIYNRILTLLLEDWDIERRIERASQFSEFDVHDKERFLRRLAFALSCKTDASFFPDELVEAAFIEVSSGFSGIENDDRKQVLGELESHTGLLVRAGHGYEFQHKTMQEYLFARHLYEFPIIPSDKSLLLAHPNELALAVSFNDNPTLYLAFLVMERFDWDFYSAEFIAPFLDRLALEEIDFPVHPYLGICAVCIYDGIRKHRAKSRSDLHQELIDRFFQLMTVNGKVGRSLHMLRQFYRVEKLDSARNSIALRRVLPVDDFYQYKEPDDLNAPFQFIEYLSPSGGPN